VGLRKWLRPRRVLPVPIGSLSVAMLPAEVQRYSEALRGAKHVIEYGSGGSTLLALRSGVSQVVTVETDPDWLVKLRTDREIQEAEGNGRLTLLYADIGPVHNYGRPKNSSSRERYPLYASLPWSYCPNPDVVLVDGRFRVSAAVASLSKIGLQPTIVVHDFWDRPMYHAILEFVDVVDRIDSLAVLRRKAVYDIDRLQAVFKEYNHNPE
jgi:hypothetical protein